jgi:hypothetical protein
VARGEVESFARIKLFAITGNGISLSNLALAPELFAGFDFVLSCVIEFCNGVLSILDVTAGLKSAQIATAALPLFFSWRWDGIWKIASKERLVEVWNTSK